MISSLLFAGLCCKVVPNSQSLLGGYSADWSRAKGSKGLLQVFFGAGRLRLRPNGRFNLMGETMEGFWRVEKGKVVLVFRSFFGRPYAVPDAQLRDRWPKSQLEGLVLRTVPDGKLILDQFGVVRGPVTFRKLPPKPIGKLVEESEEIQSSEDFLLMDAYSELTDRGSREWRSILAYVANPKNPVRLRGWATYFFGSFPPEGIKAASKLLDTLTPATKSEKDQRYLNNSIVDNVSRYATMQAVEAILRNEDRLKIRATDVLDAIGKAKYVAGASRLLDSLGSQNEYERRTALDSLSAMHVTSALPEIRKLTVDTVPMVRVAAWSAVLGLSSDATDRESAISALSKEFGQQMFGDREVYAALGKSHDSHAVPILATKLMADIEPRDRADAAKALGELGVPEAILALREAKAKLPKLQGKAEAPIAETNPKKLQKYFDQMFSLMELMKEIEEALWKHYHPVGGKGRSESASRSRAG